MMSKIIPIDMPHSGSRQGECQILQGDCREILPTLADESAQCCVTSPPYWGLRDYGVEGQIGMEKTPEQYVKKLVWIFLEVWRILKKDGTLWLNLGDSYNSAASWGREGAIPSRTLSGGKPRFSPNSKQATNGQSDIRNAPHRKQVAGLKTKDLIGIPWLVAFALRASGWYLRQDIIWHKPNPMPESVTDRCTKAHEYVFLMTKSARYFFDPMGIQEEGVYPAGTMAAKGSVTRTKGGFVNGRPPEYKEYNGKRNKRDVWTVQSAPYKGSHFATFPPNLIRPMILSGSRTGDVVIDPFGGSGTVGQVANELGRKSILIELQTDYLPLIRERIGLL
jgi:DNA modification methylase